MLDETAEYIHNALELAVMTQFAYQRDAGGAAGQRFGEVTPLGDKGFVATLDRHTIVAFRGVDDPRDWLKSLDYKQVDGYGGRVHRGFASALDSVWERLESAVAEPSRTLWIAGHSMGGALAVLTAQRLAEQGREPFATFTFGAPRVFDPAAARAFRPRVYRFVNERDIVPAFPTWGPRHRFTHVGERLLLLPNGGVAYGARRWMLAARRLLRDGIPGLARRTGAWFLGTLEDHDLDRYVENLRATVDLSLPS